MTAPGRSALFAQVLGFVAEAADAYRGTPGQAVLDDLVDRLHEPLRVAIAGRVKAGKSTLLNALVGEELAPTDAGECTRIVTWYRHGLTYRATLHPRHGPPHQVPFTRDGAAIEVQLGGLAPEDVERLTIEWPSSTLEAMTLIDTPGIGSLTPQASASSLAFLTPDDDEEATPSDAVVYLLRHLHAVDVQFLEAFSEEEHVLASPVNAIAVLSRCDEVAAGRLDALESAAQIAERYRHDGRLRQLVADVVPVAGLLAQAACTLREVEYRQLRVLAELPVDVTELLLLSADRFVSSDPSDVTGPAGPPGGDGTGAALPPAYERRQLVDRLGVFGVRLSMELIRAGLAATSGQLAAELQARSGIERLRAVLFSQFNERRDALKVRSALAAAERLLALHPVPAGRALAARLEQIRSGAHDLTELRLLNALRSGDLGLSPTETNEAERLLGLRGTGVAARLDVDEATAPTVLRNQAIDALGRWRARAESPLSSLTEREAARIVVRTCEGLVARLADPAAWP